MNAIRSQDVVVAVGLFALQSSTTARSQLADILGQPRPRISESVRRLEENNLYSKALARIRAARFFDFLVHGLPWMFPAQPGELVLGIPTAHSGPHLNQQIVSSKAYVWASEHGTVQGRSIKPIDHRALPLARVSSDAYALLSLADAVRVGRVREKKLATKALERLLRR